MKYRIRWENTNFDDMGTLIVSSLKSTHGKIVTTKLIDIGNNRGSTNKKNRKTVDEVVLKN